MLKHTFVIPAYKDSPYLESCIKSLLAQTVQSTLIMTTSTPSSYLKELGERYDIPYFVTTQPSSIAGDWNFALSKAAGGWVTIAHQDDIYHPEYVSSILQAVSKAQNDDALMAFSSYADLVEGSTRGFSVNALVKKILLLPFHFSRIIRQPFLKRSVLLFGDPICCPAVTLNLNVLTDFAFSQQYTCVLDWYAWLQLSKKKGAFVYVDKKLVLHRIHPESETTNQISNGRRQQEELEMFEQMWGKRIARFITKIYAAGHKDNRV